MRLITLILMTFLVLLACMTAFESVDDQGHSTALAVVKARAVSPSLLP